MPKLSSNRLGRGSVILYTLILLTSSLFTINLSEATLETSIDAVVVGAIITGPDVVGLNKSVIMEANPSPSDGVLINWQVANGTGEATIDPYTGLLTGTKVGTVTVTVQCSYEGRIGTSKPFTVLVIDGFKVIPDSAILCLGDY